MSTSNHSLTTESKYWAHQRRNIDGSVTRWSATIYSRPVDLAQALSDLTAGAERVGAVLVGIRTLTQDQAWGGDPIEYCEQ